MYEAWWCLRCRDTCPRIRWRAYAATCATSPALGLLPMHPSQHHVSSMQQPAHHHLTRNSTACMPALLCYVPHGITHDAPALSLFYPSHLQRHHSLTHSLDLYCRSCLTAGPRHFIPGRCVCPGGFQPAEPSLGAVLESVAGPGEGGCTPCWCDASPPAQKPATCCLLDISQGLALHM